MKLLQAILSLLLPGAGQLLQAFSLSPIPANENAIRERMYVGGVMFAVDMACVFSGFFFCIPLIVSICLRIYSPIEALFWKGGA